MRPNRTTIFISHASEDKEKFVRPLAHALKKLELQVWYDEFSLKLGDSLRRSIDKGLAECSAGVVVLSPAFFAKEWPQRELDALYAAEVAGRTHILPIWHEVDSSYIARISPLLADRRAALSSNGIEQVSMEIAGHFPASAVFTGKELAGVLGAFSQQRALRRGSVGGPGCRYRFLLMNTLKEEYREVADRATERLTDTELEDFPAGLDHWLKQEHNRLRHKHGIPENAYLSSDEPVRERHLASFLEAIDGWASGTLSVEDSTDLVVDLGTGFDDGYEEIFRLCQELRRLDGDT